MIKSLLDLWIKRDRAYRDPRHVVVAIAATLLLVMMTLQAIQTRTKIDGFEMSLFSFFNTLPSWLDSPFFIITQLGALGAVLIWGGLGLYLRNARAGAVIAAAGALAWFVAKPFKVYVGRGRPQDLLELPDLLHLEKFGGMGFPSGHASVTAACITALLFYVDRKQRKYLYLIALLIGASRIYLGAHFPRDVIGGYALGALIGSLVSLVFGSAKPKISFGPIKRRLAEMGIQAKSVRKMNVDARGSVPIFIEDEAGKSYVAKLFGKQEYVADWLFKALRFFKFKSFGDERPYLNSKHNVEHEALASMWSVRAGVRTPEVVGYALAGSHWMLTQEWVDATPLDGLKPKNVTDKTLARIWSEVKKLHKSNIAHRDLRAANILVDKKGLPWLIDFGFAEVAAKSTRKSMDIAELLMSSALVVGEERAYKTAKRVLGAKVLKEAAPYFQLPVFSGATTSLARKNKDVYKAVCDRLNNLSDEDEVEKANVSRLNSKRLINIIAIGVFLFIVLPQFGAFKGAFVALKSINFWWLIPILILSGATYITAAMTTLSLAPTPLKFMSTIAVQVASSFVSKLLPSGLGSITLFVRYLHKAGLDISTATSLMVVGSFLGFITFMSPLALILLLHGSSLSSLVKIKLPLWLLAIVPIVILFLGSALWFIKKLRKKVLERLNKAREDFRLLASSPKELGLAAMFSAGTTLMYVACLHACFLAVGIDISPLTTIVVYATATIAGSALPTPGGLGALEVAMAAALVGLGYPQVPAYAAVILYRLATFWAPIPVGFLAYQYIQKKKFI